MNGSGTQSEKSATNESAASGGTGKQGGASEGSSSQSSGAKPSGGSQGQQGKEQQGSGKSAGGDNAIELLKADHREVEKMFAEFEKAADSNKDELAEQICKALTIHAMLEEEIFYPACREKVSEEDMLNEAQVEHDSVKILIAEVWGARSRDPFRDAKVKVMSEQVTGFAGPGGKRDEEGLVHIAAASREGGMIHRECHFGSRGRQQVPLLAARGALELLGELIGEESKPTTSRSGDGNA